MNYPASFPKHCPSTLFNLTWKSCKVASEQMKGNSEGSKDADVGFELNVKSREMLDEGQKCGGVGRGGVASCLRAPTLVSYFFGK